ncbi:hypothetical protein DSLASN_20290 [Desulfoluna limicola]|uniref:DUF4136 domain-containing protein n=1 Tax=Desulfoluna limicola TaxID=2810562 RepID=A0ABM7PFN4_9BACT|nr:DUF4136 domain-containing protein [Desulfoluna limicola]BCS96397.1 hypothetical protein DSLASN_20290 [Desulfoluna limicola]
MKYTWGFIVAVTLAMAGCSGIVVKQDYDPASNFGVLTTYNWATETQEEAGDPRIDNPLRNERIRSAVERVLQEKGFAKTTDGSPAFQIRYQCSLRRKIESSGTSGSIAFGTGSRGRYGGIGLGTGSNVSQYDEETLTIDFVGDVQETLFWRGIGSQRFTEYSDPAKSTRSINLLVEKILAQFPPK